MSINPHNPSFLNSFNGGVSRPVSPESQTENSLEGSFLEDVSGLFHDNFEGDKSLNLEQNSVDFDQLLSELEQAKKPFSYIEETSVSPESYIHSILEKTRAYQIENGEKPLKTFGASTDCPLGMHKVHNILKGFLKNYKEIKEIFFSKLPKDRSYEENKIALEEFYKICIEIFPYFTQSIPDFFGVVCAFGTLLGTTKNVGLTQLLQDNKLIFSTSEITLMHPLMRWVLLNVGKFNIFTDRNISNAEGLFRTILVEVLNINFNLISSTSTNIQNLCHILKNGQTKDFESLRNFSQPFNTFFSQTNLENFLKEFYLHKKNPINPPPLSPFLISERTKEAPVISSRLSQELLKSREENVIAHKKVRKGEPEPVVKENVVGLFVKQNSFVKIKLESYVAELSEIIEKQIFQERRADLLQYLEKNGLEWVFRLESLEYVKLIKPLVDKLEAFLRSKKITTQEKVSLFQLLTHLFNLHCKEGYVFKTTFEQVVFLSQKRLPPPTSLEKRLEGVAASEMAFTMLQFIAWQTKVMLHAAYTQPQFIENFNSPDLWGEKTIFLSANDGDKVKMFPYQGRLGFKGCLYALEKGSLNISSSGLSGYEDSFKERFCFTLPQEQWKKFRNEIKSDPTKTIWERLGHKTPLLVEMGSQESDGSQDFIVDPEELEPRERKRLKAKEREYPEGELFERDLSFMDRDVEPFSLDFFRSSKETNPLISLSTSSQKAIGTGSQKRKFKDLQIRKPSPSQCSSSKNLEGTFHFSLGSMALGESFLLTATSVDDLFSNFGDLTGNRIEQICTRNAGSNTAEEAKKQGLSQFVAYLERLLNKVPERHSETVVRDMTALVSLMPHLMPYQKQALATFLQAQEVGLVTPIAMEMGTGKSLVMTALLLRSILRNPDKNRLVLTPVSVRDNFTNELRFALFHAQKHAFSILLKKSGTNNSLIEDIVASFRKPLPQDPLKAALILSHLTAYQLLTGEISVSPPLKEEDFFKITDTFSGYAGLLQRFYQADPEKKALINAQLMELLDIQRKDCSPALFVGLQQAFSSQAPFSLVNWLKNHSDTEKKIGMGVFLHLLHNTTRTEDSIEDSDLKTILQYSFDQIVSVKDLSKDLAGKRGCIALGTHGLGLSNDSVFDITLVDEAQNFHTPGTKSAKTLAEFAEKQKDQGGVVVPVSGTLFENDVAELLQLLTFGNPELSKETGIVLEKLYAAPLGIFNKIAQSKPETRAEGIAEYENTCLASLKAFWHLRNFLKTMVISKEKYDPDVLKAWAGLIPRMKMVTKRVPCGKERFPEVVKKIEDLYARRQNGMVTKVGGAKTTFFDLVKLSARYLILGAPLPEQISEDSTMLEIQKTLKEENIDIKNSSPLLSSLIEEPIFQEYINEKKHILISVTYILLGEAATDVLANTFGLERKQIRFFQGSLSEQMRSELVKWFNKHEGYTKILLLSPAGESGINLPGTDLVVDLSTTYNPKQREQTIARAFRGGSGNQEKTVLKLFLENIAVVEHEKVIIDYKDLLEAFLMKDVNPEDAWEKWQQIYLKELEKGAWNRYYRKDEIEKELQRARNISRFINHNAIVQKFVAWVGALPKKRSFSALTVDLPRDPQELFFTKKSEIPLDLKNVLGVIEEDEIEEMSGTSGVHSKAFKMADFYRIPISPNKNEAYVFGDYIQKKNMDQISLDLGEICRAFEGNMRNIFLTKGLPGCSDAYKRLRKEASQEKSVPYKDEVFHSIGTEKIIEATVNGSSIKLVEWIKTRSNGEKVPFYDLLIEKRRLQS